MRKRFPISTHLEFKQALTAKNIAKDASPDKAYQIRKYANGFRLVERLSSQEAQKVQEMRNGKRRNPKRRSRAVL
jgi:hypothetical protein